MDSLGDGPQTCVANVVCSQAMPTCIVLVMLQVCAACMTPYSTMLCHALHLTTPKTAVTPQAGMYRHACRCAKLSPRRVVCQYVASNVGIASPTPDPVSMSSDSQDSWVTLKSFCCLQGLSPECNDVMTRLLEVDPDKRITVPEVLKHPWFMQELPEGMANLNNNLLQIPLSLQSGNCKQSEEEIVQLTNMAIQGSKARRGLSYGNSGLGASSGVSLE